MIIGDSAWPPTQYPTAFNGQPVVGWCVYIGGDTPHVWTDDEIQHLMEQPHIRYLVPIFTRSNPQGAPEGQQDAAAGVLWAKAHGQPRGTLTMVDYETAVDSPYEQAFDAGLHAGDGDLEILYGSKSVVTQNARPSGGYDEAAWTGVDYAPSDTADQFVDVGAYDLNEFRSTVPLWDLHPVPTPIPAPPAPQPEETDMPIYLCSTPAGIWALFPSGEYIHVDDTAKLDSIKAVGAKSIDFSAGMHDAMLAQTGQTIKA